MSQTAITESIEESDSNINPRSTFCYRWIPARVVFVVLGFLAFNLVYAYKVVLSVTIVAMTQSKNSSNFSNSSSEFNWSHSQQAQLLSSFFYGYVVTQLPAGVLSETLGAKWIFGGGILTCALLSLLGPTLARWNFYAFLVSRIGQGLAEGITVPAMNSMLGKWVPKMERSVASTVIFSGSQIGTVVTSSVAGILCDSDFLGGWPAIFYLLGIAGVTWSILWFLLHQESPNSHSCITKRELNYILEGRDNIKPTQKPPIPWKQIFSSVPMYALMITHFGQNWGYLTILTLLPTYFKKVLDLDIKKNGFLSSFPYLLQAICGCLAAVLCDRLRKIGRFRINTIRKASNSIAFFIPGALLILVPFSTNTTLSVALFAVAMTFNGCFLSGFHVTHVDMAPEFAGTLMGITNTLANTAGFIGPQVADAIVDGNNTRQSWSLVFYIAGGVYLVTGLVYNVFGSAKLQPWGKLNSQQ